MAVVRPRRCRGPRQETLLRMLENTLHHAERPDELIVYAGLAKAARDHAALATTITALRELDENETLVIQSGKPIGVFPTGPSAPLVLMATSNLIGRWATAEHFYELERRGLIMWGGYTAGDWQYIGSQGILQGTYQTLSAVADEHFGGDLAGRLVVTAGLGGMGGAQPLATYLAGGVALCVEADSDRIARRIGSGYLERATDSLDEALDWVAERQRAEQPASVGLLGNAAEALPAMRARGLVPDVVTDQTPAHDLRYYVPVGMSPQEAAELRESDPDELVRRARDAVAEHVRCMLDWQDAGAVVFEYGNNIRAQAAASGVDAFRIPIFMERYIRPLFCRGLGPFRWVAASGDPADIDRIDEIVTREFPGNPLAGRWIPLARRYVRQPEEPGLPARISWLAHGERARLAVLVNDAVRRGDLNGPVAFTRDHLDAGGVSQPLRETENMPDGSDAVSDWPLLNALLTAGSGADLVAIHAGGGGYAGYMQSAGVTAIADGTRAAGERLSAVLTADTGIGIMRYADAGYETAAGAVRESGLRWFG
ncbi:urocanate hydratase [Spongiactinospora sp. TRM90649]|uniref:urocanate hydratase n=1 Tax=Spongiactinospora sp. TRM90649 TaxID=3031114 RepID=UPI0023F7AA07|nr:urocanate hydratase [Spongiactinospora sp. TRM90649]MDF5751662.1 urocanate hydratase [Spongiactinospora sp. TRM90649]